MGTSPGWPAQLSLMDYHVPTDGVNTKAEAELAEVREGKLPISYCAYTN